MFAPENRTINDLISKHACDSENVVLINHSGIDMDKNILEDAIKNRGEEELANLKHIHNTFLVKMSLACWHQAMRQRTWNQSVESIYDAAERFNFITPQSILKNKDYSIKYMNLNFELAKFYHDLIGCDIPKQEAVGVLPHSLTIYDLIHADGWNAIHAIGKRTCTEAQWEIRGIAKKMADLIKEVNPVLGRYAEPQGIVYGRCPERKPCGYCEKKLAK